MKQLILGILVSISLLGQTTVNGRRSFSGLVNAQTGTYQVLTTDFNSPCGIIPVASGTFTVTLVASGSQPPAGQCVTVINYGSGMVTIARSGQNINGGTSSLTLAAGSATSPTSATVVSDGTNYEASTAGTAVGLSISGWYITDGSNYYSGPHMAPMTLPVAGSFAWVNQGAATETANGNALTLFAPQTSGDQLRVRTQSIGANTTLTAQFSCTDRLTDNNSCFIGLRESSTGKIETFGVEMGTTAALKTSVNRWSSATTFVSTAVTEGGSAIDPTWVSYRIVYTSGSPGTVSFQKSFDDSSWIVVFSEAANVAFTTAPNQFLYGANANNATSGRDQYITLYSFKMQ